MHSKIVIVRMIASMTILMVVSTVDYEKHEASAAKREI